MPKIWGWSNDAKRRKKEDGRMENKKGDLDCLNHNVLVEGRPLLSFKKCPFSPVTDAENLVFVLVPAM